MKRLAEREGEMIAALIPFIHTTVIQQVRLILVEDAGIWIESQAMTNMWMEALKRTGAPKTLVYFVPWQQIVWIMDSIDVPGLSDKAAQV